MQLLVLWIIMLFNLNLSQLVLPACQVSQLLKTSPIKVVNRAIKAIAHYHCGNHLGNECIWCFIWHTDKIQIQISLHIIWITPGPVLWHLQFYDLWNSVINSLNKERTYFTYWLSLAAWYLANIMISSSRSWVTGDDGDCGLFMCFLVHMVHGGSLDFNQKYTCMHGGEDASRGQTFCNVERG